MDRSFALKMYLVYLFIIISTPAYGSVEPEYGSFYLASYSYSAGEIPVDVNAVELKIFSPQFSETPVLQKKLDPSTKNWSLDNDDHKKITNNLWNLITESKNNFLKSHPSSGSLGMWKYQFIINNKEYPKQDGPDIILDKERPAYDGINETITIPIYATESPLKILLKLKYVEDENFRDFKLLGKGDFRGGRLGPKNAYNITFDLISRPNQFVAEKGIYWLDVLRDDNSRS